MCHYTQLLQHNPKCITDICWYRTRVSKFNNSVKCNNIKYVILRDGWHLILKDLEGQTIYPTTIRSLGGWCVPLSCHCPSILFLTASPQTFLFHVLCPLRIKKYIYMTFSICLWIITSSLAFLFLIQWDWELNVYYLILIMHILDLDIEPLWA